MQSLYIFSSFWCASVFYILSIQGRDVIISNSLVNETDETTVTLKFKKFVQKFNKSYVNDPEEYNRRMSVFKVGLLIKLPCGLVSIN